MENQMSVALNRIKSWLAKEEVNFGESSIPERDNVIILNGDMQGLNALFMKRIKFYIMVSEEDLQCYMVLTHNIDEKHRHFIMEYITRVNYGLKYGAFEMDLNDGEIRFHMALPTQSILMGDEEYIKPILEKFFHFPLSSMNQYVKGIEKLTIKYSEGENITSEVIKAEHDRCQNGQD
jgi:hypothetical protein